jgi:type VI secretion system Hcp family effector
VKIEGECLQPGYEKQIDVASLGHGLSRSMVADKAAHSRAAGRCVHEDFSCLMRMNKAYPKLMEACSKGTTLGKAELVIVKMNEGKTTEVAKYVLTDVYVASLTLSEAAVSVGHGTQDVSNESALPWLRVNLSYQSIAVTYTEYGVDGKSVGVVSCAALAGFGA